MSQLGNKRIISLDNEGKVVRTIPLERGACGMTIVDGCFYLITGDDELEDLRFTKVDARGKEPAVTDLATVPFDARALAYDGSRFWTCHRDNNEIVAFTVWENDFVAFAALILTALLAQASPPMQGPPPPTSAGDKLLASGDFDAAFTAYQAAETANHLDANAMLGIGTIYLYRNDLLNARAALGAAAMQTPNDRRVQSRLRALDGRTADQSDLPMHGDATVKFIATDPLPMLHVTVNGKVLTFLLDTGGPGIDIAADTAQKLGLKMIAAGQGTFAGGKTAPIQRTHLASFAVGGVTLKNADSGVLPGGPMVMAGHHVDGVLGTGFLSHFISTIDYKRGELILRPRSASAEFLARARQSGATIVPMWLVGDHFIFADAHIGNAPSALFNIDTGGGGMGVQLTRAQLDAAQITVDPSRASSFRGGGGATRAITFNVPSVTLGSVTESDVPGMYFPDGDQYGIFPFAVGGTLSHEFFKKTALTFDFVSMKLIVSK